VINWYNFEEGSSVLEIGAGCGAITEELIKKPVTVTSLELTQMRSRINAHRNKHANNLNIVVGNLTDYHAPETYDYIVCVGVLEYAGTFIDSDHPYEAFLSRLRSMLKPGGKLIVAIENRFGLKYWAGAKEDHTGDWFDGLNRYPNKAVQTFGRLELEKLMLANEFTDTDFYYPYPDYKHPRIVYSDDYHPGKGAEFPLNSLPTPVPGQARVQLFSEGLTMLSIEQNGLFPHFANSFIVVAER
jgi:SAM-dependent methyltransferase